MKLKSLEVVSNWNVLFISHEFVPNPCSEASNMVVHLIINVRNKIGNLSEISSLVAEDDITLTGFKLAEERENIFNFTTVAEFIGQSDECVSHIV